MSFVPLWLIFLASGLVISVLALLWASRTRQFEQQDRARFLPLHGLEARAYARDAGPRRAGAGTWVTLTLTGLGGVLIWATLLLVLSHAF